MTYLHLKTLCLMMREPAFLRKNKDAWLEYEQELFSEDTVESNPDKLANLYIRLTDDLAYARTFYPRSKVHRYLNGLAARTHLLIYQHKKHRENRLLTFWTRELPLIYKEAHRYMFISLLIFVGSLVLGFWSAVEDPSFVRAVMGDQYVDMTLQNIQNGRPTDVYNNAPPFEMFVSIAFNNLFVSFMVFIMGIFFSAGTIVGIPLIGKASGLFQNGVSIGAFFGMFLTQGVLSKALPIVFIHGALELSAITIAGGAGLMLGNALLFPGTYTRREAVRHAAKNGMKIMVGLVPVIVLAAFLESYVTRLADMPLLIKMLIIVASLSYVVWFYILYPRTVAGEIAREADPE